MPCQQCEKLELDGEESKAKKLYEAAETILRLCLDSTAPLDKLTSLCEVMRAHLAIAIGAQPLKAVPTGDKAAMFMKELAKVGGNRTRLAREMGVNISTVRYWTGNTSKKRSKSFVATN